MGLFNTIKRLLAGKERPRQTEYSRPTFEPEPEPDVPEISAADLMIELAQSTDILLLDCREPYERRMVHIPGDVHIPMDEIPQRLAELEESTDHKTREVVVYCASGMRSFGVAHFLNEQGFTARNLAGGITRWQMAKGPVAQG